MYVWEKSDRSVSVRILQGMMAEDQHFSSWLNPLILRRMESNGTVKTRMKVTIDLRAAADLTIISNIVKS